MNSLLSLLLAAALPVPAPPPAAALDWFTCGKAMDAQCGYLTVPVDWAHPGGAKIKIAVGKRAAPDQEHKVGTLVFGPGGPWDPGVDRVTNGYHRFSANLLARFDIVSFDPRGSTGSQPVSCDPAQVAAVPNPVLTSQADFDATLAYNRELWAECERRTGDLWNHAGMTSNVRDLDALRAALGERQLTFQGSSYGTLLGEAYAERYPQRVRAIVLESVDDHSSRSTAEFLTAQAWASEDAFDAFVSWCDRTASCALHGRDVPAIWNHLYDSAVAGRPDFTPFDLVAITYKRTKDVDYDLLADYLEAVDGGRPGVRLGSLPVVLPAFCADWSLPARDYREYASLLRQAARVAPDTHFPAQVMALTACLGWEDVTYPQHELHVRTATPLLLLNSRHDSATGWNWARNVERQLGRHGVLVTYEGDGHGSYSISQCMRNLADAYLISRTVPPRGTSCAAGS
ncbi:pimeloyl-ACP methyl ester carboxylesterase [Actinoplanes tereljensis]|uniref:Peptidase n=1 Tax=Paractinoplanes tereljensis TaxID=571912 RepID=A0A919NFZ4_9ACTN|nr:alpha/beta fold hydrolase [Actinoplanes tereljensis]GIF17904.1 peptidase [Actinoplanes tereljensis]